jgi:hypothetical protein
VGPLRVLAPWCEGLVDRFFRRRLRHELAGRAPQDRAE